MATEGWLLLLMQLCID